MLKQLQIGFVPFSPLGKGFLTATINNKASFGENDIRHYLPRFTPDAIGQNQQIITLIEDAAKSKDTTPAQNALAWILAQKDWIVPIPGTRKLHRLRENLGAAEIILSAEEVRLLNESSDKIKIIGERYTPEMEKATGL